MKILGFNHQNEIRVGGEIPTSREHFYAVTVERRLKPPAVVAISESAGEDIFKQ
jgi:hypothetical protein